MLTVEASTIINRPLADVFAFVANFENHPQWETDFLEAQQVTAQPGGVGTTYQCVLKLPGRRAKSQFKITEYEVNRKITFEGEVAGPAKPKGSYLFEVVAEGTRVTARPRPELRGIFKWLEPLMAPYIRRQNQAHLKKLKTLLEA